MLFKFLKKPLQQLQLQRLFSTKLWHEQITEIFQTKGGKFYGNCLVTRLSSKDRSELIRHYGMSVYANYFKAVVGSPRDFRTSQKTPLYTFHDETENKKIQMKSSLIQLSTSKTRERCVLDFDNIKPLQFDKLILVVIFPKSLSFWLYDGNQKITNNSPNRHRNGNRLQYSKYCHIPDFKPECGLHLNTIYIDNQMQHLCLEKLRSSIYFEKPFYNLSDPNVGLLFENFAMSIFAKTFGPIQATKPNAPFDFLDVDGHQKVEVKFSRITNEKIHYQKFHFRHVKPENFDKLILIAYFPNRLEFHLWDQKKRGLSSDGRSRNTIRFYKPKGVEIEEWKPDFGHLFYTIYLDEHNSWFVDLFKKQQEWIREAKKNTDLIFNVDKYR
jgi:hypothetical protein